MTQSADLCRISLVLSVGTLISLSFWMAEEAYYNQGLGMAWIALFCFDFLIFILTLFKSYRQSCEVGNFRVGGSTLLILMARDGA